MLSFLAHAFWDRTASRIGRRSRHSPPAILKRCIRRTTSPRIRRPQALPARPIGGCTDFPRRIQKARHGSSSSRSCRSAKKAGRPRTRPRRSLPTSCTATSTPGSRPAISVQRDGAARPSRRPRHGCHHPMARRGCARSFTTGNDRGHRRRTKRCMRRGRLQSGQPCRRHRSSAGRDVCGALRRLAISQASRR